MRRPSLLIGPLLLAGLSFGDPTTVLGQVGRTAPSIWRQHDENRTRPPALLREGGGYFVGTKGILMYDTYGDNPRLFPESLKADADRVPQTVERVATNHVMNWANAVMEKAKPSSDFAYAAPLTETMLLGIVALRTGQGRKIVYDGAAGRITNLPEANYLLGREYRAGWSL